MLPNETRVLIVLPPSTLAAGRPSLISRAGGALARPVRLMTALAEIAA